MTRILIHPVATEKSMMMLERENKMLFVVDSKATKKEIKEAFEKTFKVKVEKVNTVCAQNGKKRAFIKIKSEFIATDIATDLGYM